MSILVFLGAFLGGIGFPIILGIIFFSLKNKSFNSPSMGLGKLNGNFSEFMNHYKSKYERLWNHENGEDQKNQDNQEIVFIFQELKKTLEHIQKIQKNIYSSVGINNDFMKEISLRSEYLLNKFKETSKYGQNFGKNCENLSFLENSFEQDIKEKFHNQIETLQENVENRSISLNSHMDNLFKTFTDLIEELRQTSASKENKERNLDLEDILKFQEEKILPFFQCLEWRNGYQGIKKLLQHLNQETTHCFAQISLKAKEDLAKLTEIQHQLDNHKNELEKNFLGINEVLENTKILVNRISRKTKNIYSVPHDLLRSLQEENTSEAFVQSQKVLGDYFITLDPKYDRLADILARKEIRVAIEPDFKGLSFRTQKNQELRGLDVEYAKAFAEWLGVGITFLEIPWDESTELLFSGKERGEKEADVQWSALPPDENYKNIAFSESYTYLDYVLARRLGDKRIEKIEDLQGKVLGCINDPAAYNTLQRAGIRWNANMNLPGGKIFLKNLFGYGDQSKIHDALADGKIDAFSVDLPIYYWACYGEDSPWKGKIEVLPGNIDSRPWFYSVGVAAVPSSYRLLKKINEFINEFKISEKRKSIELSWQGKEIRSELSYKDISDQLWGEKELQAIYEKNNEKNHLMSRRIG